MAGRLGTRGRFAVAYLLLGAAVGAGIGTFIVLVERPTPPPPPAWSSWQPGASGISSQLLEIANHVGQSYRLPSGDQLTAVKVGGTHGGQQPNLQGIAVLNKGAPQQVDKQYAESDTAFYVLCGATKTCSIPEGTPSRARGTVLRREALELALYTLEYAHPIDNVLVFFPPPPGQKTLSSTLFFHRDDLSSSLKHPLRTTLPQPTPPLPGKIAPQEEKTVNDLTGEQRYHYLGISQNFVVIRPGA
jgi:hypothetical protein